MLKYFFALCGYVYMTSIAMAVDMHKGVAYCHGKNKIEIALVNSQTGTAQIASDVDVTFNGKTYRYMTAYSWYGSIEAPPKGFKYAILGEHQFDPLLVFDDYLLDNKKNRYGRCE